MGTDHAGTERFELFTILGDAGTARIWAARLESEGIEARLHGEPLGPYPVTVGKLAETQIWVPAGRIDEARRVFLEAEVDALAPEADADDGVAVPWRWVASGILAVIVAVVLRAL
jgi:hypothetical protein